jgi:hypothetical protein
MEAVIDRSRPLRFVFLIGAAVFAYHAWVLLELSRKVTLEVVIVI